MKQGWLGRNAKDGETIPPGRFSVRTGFRLALLLSIHLPAGLYGQRAEGPRRPAVVRPLPQGHASPVDPHTDCLSCHPHGAITGPVSPAPASGQARSAAAAGGSSSQGLSTGCMVCHQGARKGATDRATKLPDWTGAGSTHIDGPFSTRPRNYARMLDVGQRKAMFLRDSCTGCHEIHAKDDAARLRTTAFDERGQLLSVKRTTVAQLCFGCHAGTEAARLLHGDSDIGALFVKGSGSAHQSGLRASDSSGLPSLRLGLFQGTLDCTSCHANPNPGGPKGPHTSPFPFLLRAAYGREADLAAAGDRSNELCFTCHDKNSILGNQSFPLHAQHIQGFTGVTGARSQRPETFLGLPLAARPSAGGLASAGFGRPTACATCHDPHGSPRSPALIRFDPAVVSRSSYGIVEFQRTGMNHGSCTLSCHGYDHVQSRY